MSVVHDTFTIERRYGCTPHQAFSAFADPELKRRWFANAGDWDDFEWELDFRVGGSERSAGGHPGGRHNEFRARYHDIVEGERIVYAYDLLHDGVLVSVSLTTVELGAEDEGTRLVFTEQGVFLTPDPEAAAQRRHGTGVLLDMLGRFLAGEPAR